MLLAAYNAGTFGGSMSAILIGTPARYPPRPPWPTGTLWQNRARRARPLRGALFSSCFGCLFSSIILVIIAQPIAKVALKFGPAEYAVLMLFSHHHCLPLPARKSLTKGLLGGCIGLFFGCGQVDASYTIPGSPSARLKSSPAASTWWSFIGAPSAPARPGPPRSTCYSSPPSCER